MLALSHSYSPFGTRTEAPMGILAKKKKPMRKNTNEKMDRMYWIQHHVCVLYTASDAYAIGSNHPSP